MSIEETLNNLTESVRILAAAVGVLATNVANTIGGPADAPAVGSSAPTATTPVAPVAAPAAAPRPRGRAPGTTKAMAAEAPTASVVAATTPAEAPAAPVVPEADPFGETPAADQPALTEGDVRSALQALKDRKGRTTEVFKLLKDIGGVETLPKLEAKFYARIIAAAKAIA